MVSAVAAQCPPSGTVPYSQQLTASAVAAQCPPSGTVPYNQQLMLSVVAAQCPPSGTVPYNQQLTSLPAVLLLPLRVLPVGVCSVY